MEAWKMRSNDVAAREILQERREAIQSGKLKGRRLFQSKMMEGESAFIINTTTTPQHEVRSMCFYTSDEEDESNGNKGVNDYSTRGCSYYSSSSSSSSSFVDDVKLVAHMVPILVKMRVDTSNSIATSRNGTRYAVFLGAFAFVLLVIAMSISFATSFLAHDRHVILVPT